MKNEVSVRHFDQNGRQMPGPPMPKRLGEHPAVDRAIRYIAMRTEERKAEEGGASHDEQGTV